MKPTSHVWRWTLLFAIGAGLLLFGCNVAPEPDPEPNEPELSSVDTDTTGLAEIPDTEMRVKVLDGLTGEPLTGMRVSAIIATDQSDAIIFVEDPDSRYAPTATSWSELEDAAGELMAQATTIIPTILMSADADSWSAWRMFEPPPELMEWWESVAYDCTINTLDNIQAEAAPDLQEFVGSFIRDGFIELWMLVYAPKLVVVMIPYSAVKTAEFIADAGISFMLGTYRGQGYEGGESFRICYKKYWQLGVPSPGPIAYWEPLSPPSSIDQRLSGLFGVVRDATTANPIAGADVYIAGPDFRSTRTNAAGEYEFTSLPTGDYEVLISRLGYYRELASVSLGQESRFRDFTIAPFEGTTTQPVFADWKEIDSEANLAVGVVGASTVTLTGTWVGLGVTDGSYTGFNRDYFTPPLATADYAGFRGHPTTYSYTLAFDPPVTDPVFHFVSLASTVTFAEGQLVRISGQPSFTVSGNSVSGVLFDSGFPNDSNGTVQLNGTFSSINFSATYESGSVDGVGLQVGVR